MVTPIGAVVTAVTRGQQILSIVFVAWPLDCKCDFDHLIAHTWLHYVQYTRAKRNILTAVIYWVWKFSLTAWLTPKKQPLIPVTAMTTAPLGMTTPRYSHDTLVLHCMSITWFPFDPNISTGEIYDHITDSSRVVFWLSSQPISHPPEFCLWYNYMYEWCDLEWGRPRVKGYKHYHHLSRKGESSVFLKTVWPPLVTKDFAGASPPVPPPLMIKYKTASRARPSS